MINVLHISNTDFLDDSRIQKEVDVLSSFSHFKIFIIGLGLNDNKFNYRFTNFTYFPLDLFIYRFLRLPKIFLFPILMTEFFIVSVYLSFKIRPHVIHCHDTFCLPTAWFIAIIFRCKLIYDAHELESNKNGQNLLFSKISLFFEKLFWYRIDGFITVSKSILNWYNINFSSKKSCILYNSPSISSNLLNYEEKYFHKKFHLNDSDIVFCYLGLFSSGRGIEMYLDYFASANCNFHIVFMGKGFLHDRILDYSNKYSNIHLHPAVKHDLVVQLVQSADWGLCLLENVSLSDFFSLPNKIFEYAFANTRIISSDFPEIDFFVKDKCLGFTCNPDYSSFCNIMDLIKKNEFLLEKKNIYEFSWDYQAIKLKEFYLNII
jgi:glycosyltransferase involved in cell wall biosynthesis